MIKTLQKKFIVTAMAAVTVLLVIILSTINIANFVIVREDSSRTLNLLSETEGRTEPAQNPMEQNPAGQNSSGQNPPEAPLEEPLEEPLETPFEEPRPQPKNQEDRMLSSNFFVVKLDEDGKVTETDVSRVSTVNETAAETFAEKAQAEGQNSGKIGKYRYKVRTDSQSAETVIVFLDTSDDLISYGRILLLSAAAGLAGWLLMLALVIALSKRAISPIADNIQRQKQFVTDAGHEIKTPLAIILANVDAMELYNGENKWSRNIRAQAVRLDGLMKSLLRLAKMDEGREKTVKSKFSLSELLQQTAAGFGASFEQKEIELHTEDIRPEVYVSADRQQTAQIFSILLDNAAKYTPRGGMLKISIEEGERRVRAAVRNSCEKLPEEKPEKLFERFYRGDKARTQKEGGYGIGLSIAKNLAEAGSCRLSAAYEEGDIICFTVEF